MPRIHSGTLRRFRHAALTVAALGVIAVLGAGQAEARVHRHHGHRSSGEAAYQPPYSAIVVDANSGQVLHAADPDAKRHPASLTKIMTVYLLFEELEAGRIKLDSRLQVSAHAVAQDPSKLDLQPGQTIEVEDAIKAIVTKSANDVAVVVAEAIGGSEDDFARMMTQKAHALGMTRTTYVNASGLPNDDQVTTARDQALLGRAIQDRFPRYYRYFSTLSFQYHGASIRNHNHLLGRVDGVDGIKTGYTRASGFNLVASVHRGDRHLVAVVLGGTSGGARDARMRSLIEEHIAEASTRRTVAQITEPSDGAMPAARPRSRMDARPEARAASTEQEPRIPASEPAIVARADTSTTAAIPVPRPGTADPIQPIQVKTISVKPGFFPTTALAPLVTARSQATIAPPQMAIGAHRQPQTTQTSVPSQPSTAQPPTQAGIAEGTASLPPPGSRPGLLGTLQLRTQPAAAAESPTPVVAQVNDTAPPAAAKPSNPHGPWMIQVGAFPDEAEAKERLKAAKSMAQKLLGNADPFTERVVKGSKEFYRARFAGLDKDGAEAACHYFQRNDIACMALKN